MRERFVELLAGTSTVVFAVGVVNIWHHSAAEAASAFAAAVRQAPGRLFLGVGIGHRPLLDKRSPGQTAKPLESIRHYLDALDGGENPVPREDMFLGALGPRMLRLAVERTAGAHPYLVTPAHTREARKLMGPNALLAPEQHVVLDTDPVRARSLARQWMAVYLGLPNYVANFHRMGFDEADLAHGGSDRMVDALVGWGDAAQVAQRVHEHLDAGADHVAVQVLVPERMTFPKDEWRTLAAELKREGQL
jgi:probable F420-dependent oxidoreductase